MKPTLILTAIIAGSLAPLHAIAESTPTAEAATTTQASSAAAAIDVASADPAAGEEIYGSVCKNCHGPTAKGMASFPKLTGQDADYLVDRLTTYRAGDSVGPNSPLMWPVAKDLSDEDIASITAYITTEFN